MKLGLADSIRRHRRERHLTQEQLAEAMNVSVGTVSRWESGENLPDIYTLADMASYFDTSVDVLVGYDLAGGGLQNLLDDMREKRNRKDFDGALAVAERLLAHYKNSFRAVYGSAVLYALAGSECRNKKYMERALELFERSLELENQNKDEKINTWTIRNDIARVLSGMGEHEKAVEQMKANNADGLNDGRIGCMYSINMKMPDEALPFLSNAIITHVCDIVGIMFSFTAAYVMQKKYADADEASAWMVSLLSGLRGTTVSEIDCLYIQALTAWANMRELLDDRDGAERLLTDAYREAVRFDRTPSSNFIGMKFYHCTTTPTAFSDFGSTAVGGVEALLAEPTDGCPRLCEVWHRLMKEQG